MKKYNYSIFIFTRDFRLSDNEGLVLSLKESNYVIPIFIFNPVQIETNKFKSNNCIQFMYQSLDDLNNQLKEKHSKLFYFYGNPEEIINKIYLDIKFDAVYISKDYSPFSQKREDKLKFICKKLNIEFNLCNNHTLIDFNKITNSQGKSYTKFTPFLNKAKRIKVEEVLTNKYTNYVSYSFKLKHEYKNIHKFYNENKNVYSLGGKTEGLKILKNIKLFNDYNKEKDYLHIETTHLSAYLKFGCISAKELYWKVHNMNRNNKIINQLYWRDFFMQILYNHPYVLKEPMKENYNVKWENNKTFIKLWKEGKTGFPIVDAAMRQLNTTGWMHNRGRLIVSNFLIKVLNCDWRIGEKYFAQHLIDYDVASNNGNWSWSGSGVDSQPYFRVFNPWRQTEKYDKDCLYIKKWIPELKDVPNKDILKWYKSYDLYKGIYYKPIIDDISERIKENLKLYRN